MDNLVINYYELLKKIKKLQVMAAKEKTVSDSVRVLRQKTYKDQVQYAMAYKKK